MRKKKQYKVLITTSGTGSRLKELTKNKNKVLIDIAGRPAIDYILQKYPDDISLVITLGYKGNQVQKFLKEKYPNKIFEFVGVDKYQGPGSSLGYSMLCAKENLQCPFIFHACDTIVDDEIPPVVDKNWVAGYKTGDSIHYRTLNIKNNKVIWINDKGAKNFDYIHIGLVGVADYQMFWKSMEDLYGENPNDETLNDTFAINQMLEKNLKFDFRPSLTWYDTGNPQALRQTIRRYKK